jgi:hypothetical protein
LIIFLIKEFSSEISALFYKLKIRKKTIIFVGLLISILVGLFYYNQTGDVKCELVYKQPSRLRMDSLIMPYTFSKDKKNINYLLLKFTQDSLHDSTTIKFHNYDCLVSYGRLIKRAYYYKHRTHPDDDCDYASGNPLTVIYGTQQYVDSIFFYEIEKRRFRDICP